MDLRGQSTLTPTRDEEQEGSTLNVHPHQPDRGLHGREAWTEAVNVLYLPITTCRRVYRRTWKAVALRVDVQLAARDLLEEGRYAPLRRYPTAARGT